MVAIDGKNGITRRRALSLFGVAAGVALVPAVFEAKAAPSLHEWSGTALGALATITLVHPDRQAAMRIFARCEAEIERLEKIFSLHRDDSEIVRLNRDGALAAPSHDMLAVLGVAHRIGVLSDGAFDVSIQPLWRAYADHFIAHPDAAEGPEDAALAAARALVDYRRIDFSPAAVRFGRPGMAITLNGIAQGYITDKVAELMRAEGIANVLIDLGEHRGLGEHPDGRPWHIGIRDPKNGERLIETLDLMDRAAATSGGYGTRFSRDGRFNHLLNPAGGESPHVFTSVTVTAPTAVLADALSTAIYVAAPETSRGMLAALPDASVVTVDAGGRVRRMV